MTVAEPTIQYMCPVCSSKYKQPLLCMDYIPLVLGNGVQNLLKMNILYVYITLLSRLDPSVISLKF